MVGADDRSDEELIDACNAGDAAAFEALYRRYRDWAVRLAYRFTGDRDESLDVMQESFAYLLSKFPGFTLSARLTSFMYVVIKHNALSGRRKQRRRPRTPGGHPRGGDARDPCRAGRLRHARRAGRAPAGFTPRGAADACGGRDEHAGDRGGPVDPRRNREIRLHHAPWRPCGQTRVRPGISARKAVFDWVSHDEETVRFDDPRRPAKHWGSAAAPPPTPPPPTTPGECPSG